MVKKHYMGTEHPTMRTGDYVSYDDFEIMENRAMDLGEAFDKVSEMLGLQKIYQKEEVFKAIQKLKEERDERASVLAKAGKQLAELRKKVWEFEKKPFFMQKDFDIAIAQRDAAREGASRWQKRNRELRKERDEAVRNAEIFEHQLNNEVYTQPFPTDEDLKRAAEEICKYGGMDPDKNVEGMVSILRDKLNKKAEQAGCPWMEVEMITDSPFVTKLDEPEAGNSKVCSLCGKQNHEDGCELAWRDPANHTKTNESMKRTTVEDPVIVDIWNRLEALEEKGKRYKELFDLYGPAIRPGKGDDDDDG